MKIRSEKQFLFLIFIISLLLKISYGFIFENKFHPTRFDFSPHEAMATNFIQGKGLTYEMRINENLTITRHYEDELVYPLLCGLVYLLTKHSFMAMLLIQILYTSFIPIFIYLVAKMLFDEKVSSLSAVLSALSPGIIVYSTSKIHSMSLYALVYCISLFAVFKYIKKQGNFNAIFLGVMLGAGLLSRNNFVLFIPFLFLYLFFRKFLSIRNLIKISIAMFVVLLPLLVRNYMVYQKIIILKPAVIWPAMNPKATGTLYDKNGGHSFSDVNKQLFSEFSHLSDLEYTDIINKSVFSNIIKNKLTYLLLSLKRFYYFWWFSPDTGKLYPKYYLTLYKPYYLFILFFALCGIIIAIANSLKKHTLKDFRWFILVVFIISTTIPHYLYYGEGRHRFALEPILLILTSYGLLFFLDKITIRIENFYRRHSEDC